MLIGDKIMETSMEELGCKCPISWAKDCRGSVSHLNDGDYSP